MASRAGWAGSFAGQAGNVTIATHRPAGPVRLTGPGKPVRKAGLVRPAEQGRPTGLVRPAGPAGLGRSGRQGWSGR